MKSRLSNLNKLHYESIRLLKHLTGIDLQSDKLHEKILNDYKSKGPGRLIEVPRVKDIDDFVFYKQYVLKAKPVVLTGKAKNWPCLKKWTPTYFKEKYGDDKILIHDTLAVKDGSTLNVEYATLKEIIECIENKDNSKYARFNDLLHRHPELICDVDAKWLLNMRTKPSTGSLFQIFIGASGTKTTLHAAASHNYFTQVYGRKHWYIISAKDDPALKPLVNRSPFFVSHFNPETPDKKAFPIADYIDKYEVELNPGDILYNPSSYWHHVTNPTDSIGLGFRWFSPNCFKINFMQTLMLLTASNPSIFYILKNRKDYSKVFEFIAKGNAR